MAVLDHLKVAINIDGVQCQEFEENDVQPVEIEIMEPDRSYLSRLRPRLKRRTLASKKYVQVVPGAHFEIKRGLQPAI